MRLLAEKKTSFSTHRISLRRPVLSIPEKGSILWSTVLGLASLGQSASLTGMRRLISKFNFKDLKNQHVKNNDIQKKMNRVCESIKSQLQDTEREKEEQRRQLICAADNTICSLGAHRPDAANTDERRLHSRPA